MWYNNDPEWIIQREIDMIENLIRFCDEYSQA